MRRPPRTKLQILDVRHPGLREKVHAMFEELSPTQAVKQLIEDQFGERLSLRSIERYKQRHWQAQRERVQQASEALIGSSAPRPIGSP